MFFFSKEVTRNMQIALMYFEEHPDAEYYINREQDSEGSQRITFAAEKIRDSEGCFNYIYFQGAYALFTFSSDVFSLFEFKEREFIKKYMRG